MSSPRKEGINSGQVREFFAVSVVYGYNRRPAWLDTGRKQQEPEPVAKRCRTGVNVSPEPNLMQEKDFENQDVVLQSASALMDDEGSELDLRRVLKGAAADPGVLDHWQRYHLIRASLGHELHSCPEVNLLPGIHARLQEEAAAQVPSRSAPALLRRAGQGFIRAGQGLTKGAVAASVAFTVLQAGTWLQTGMEDGLQADGSALQTAAAGAQARMPSLGGDFTPSELTRTVSMDPAARRRLQQAVYQSSGLQPHPFGEPYVFPESPEAEARSAAAGIESQLPLEPAVLR